MKECQSYFTNDDFLKISRFIRNYEKQVPIGISDKILTDARTYNKNECITIWNSQDKRIRQNYKFITDLVKIFGRY